MSYNIYLTSSTIQTSVASLLIDNYYARDLITKYYVPNIFRYYNTSQYSSFLDEVQNDFYAADNMDKTLFYLFPPSQIDNDLYFNTNDILYQLTDFIKSIQNANQIYSSNVISSCSRYNVPWEATYFVYNYNHVKPYSILTVQDFPLSFYDQCLYYQEAFSLYSSSDMLVEYESFNPLNDYFNPRSFIGYILQRAVYVQEQVLNFCQQYITQKQGYLPAQYISFWSVPEKAKEFVDYYSPEFYYGNQFLL